MYAVIETGNKQYRVELGSEIQVDRLDVQAGDSITLDRVLLIADGDETAVGRPVVEGATVSAEVVGPVRGEKIVVFKYKPKARHRVKKGFRAELTALRISEIAFAGRSAAKDAEKSDAKKDKAAKAAEKAAADQAIADKDLASKLAAASEPVEPKADETVASSTKTDAKPKTDETVASSTKTDAKPKTATGKSPSEAASAASKDTPDSADAAEADEAPAVAEDTQKDE